MILRRFLQHTKEQNWFAVGLDVVVVIVGIFLGMQVTDWNEEREQQQLKINYFSNMRFELLDDIEDWQSIRNSNSEKAVEAIEIINALRSENEITAKSDLVIKVQRLFRAGPMSTNSSTYADLVSSGNMEVIDNQSLRQEIIDHYNRVDRFLDHANREIDIVWEHFHPFFLNNGYYDFAASSEGVNRDSLQIESFIFKDKPGSREFKALENNLAFRRVILSSQNKAIDQILERTEALIKMLEQELEDK